MRKCMARRAGRSERVLSKSVVEVCVVDASRVASRAGAAGSAAASASHKVACVGDDRLLSDS